MLLGITKAPLLNTLVFELVNPRIMCANVNPAKDVLNGSDPLRIRKSTIGVVAPSLCITIDKPAALNVCPSIMAEIGDEGKK